jgi:hypothetical protein
VEEERMDSDRFETDAVLDIRYGEHIEDNDRLDVIGEAIEDLLEDAGEVSGARDKDGWMNEVLLYDIGQLEHWLKRITALLRRRKAPAGTTIEVVVRFRAEKVLKRIGIHDKEDA